MCLTGLPIAPVALQHLADRSVLMSASARRYLKSAHRKSARRKTARCINKVAVPTPEIAFGEIPFNFLYFSLHFLILQEPPSKLVSCLTPRAS